MHDRILAELYKIEPKKAQLVKLLEKVLFLNSRSIYNRLEGKTPFSINELEIIFKNFNISPLSIFATQNIQPEILYTSPRKIIDEFLKSWLSAIISLKNTEFESVFVISNYLPFSLVLSFPNLVKLRFYFLLQSCYKDLDFFNDAFELSSPIFSNVDSICATISKEYKILSSTEIWGSNTLKICAKQVLFLLSIGKIDHSEAIIILEDLIRLVNISDRYSLNKQKRNSNDYNFISHRYNYNLFYNDKYNVGEYTIFSFNQGRGIESIVFNPLQGFIEKQLEKRKVIQYAKLLRFTGLNLSEPLNVDRAKFFIDLKNYLTKILTDVKEHLAKTSVIPTV